MEYVYIAFIAMIGPVILSIINGYQRKRDKEEDWARQDLVAARVEEAAQKAVEVAKQASVAARLLLQENRRTAEYNSVTNGKIDAVALQATEIHELVNSAMSEEMRRNMESQEAVLLVLLELKEVKETSGLGISEDLIARIEATKSTISDLKTALVDRAKAAKAAEVITRE